MRIMKATLCSSFILAVALIAVPGTASAAPSPVTGTSTPIQAVKALVMPFTARTPNACNAVTGQVVACPITARLRYRLQHYQQGENGNIVCRCQNPPKGIRVEQIDANAFVAHVNTRWTYGASESYTITFVVGRQDDGWRVDDEYCAGRPRTSVYNPPAGPCV